MSWGASAAVPVINRIDCIVQAAARLDIGITINGAFVVGNLLSPTPIVP